MVGLTGSIGPKKQIYMKTLAGEFKVPNKLTLSILLFLLLAVSYQAKAQSPTISGPTSVCTNASGVTYYTDGGVGPYTWDVTGGIIVGGGGTETITVTWGSTPGIGTVSVTTTTGNSSISVTINARPVPTITGTTSICQNSTGIVYFTETGMSGYSWTISPGGTITAGAGTSAITVSWLSAGTQTVTVNYSNSAGCSASTPTAKLVTVMPTPVPTITGASTACTGNTLSYSTEPGMVNYVWNVLSGGTITSGGSTNVISVNWTSAGTHTITVSYINSSGCPTLIPTAKGITVNQSPSPTITGQDTTCLNGILAFSTEPGMALYTWAVGPGGIILSGQGTSSISSKWTQAGIRTVTVSYTNTSGCPASTVKNITIYSPPIPVITGPAFGCVGGAGSVFSTATGMTGYTWSVSTGGTITSGDGTATITVTWTTTGAKSVYVSYTDTHGCTPVTPAQYNLTIYTRPSDPVITGPATACAGSTGNTYSTQPGMASYSWSVTPGGTITGGSGTSTITVTWNTAGVQTVNVNYTNTSGCNAVNPGTLNTTVNTLPVPTISGPGAACVNSIGNIYSTEPGMSGYIWTVTSGGSITGGSGTNAITVTWNTSGTQTVTVNYTNSNSCTAASPATKNVTINTLPVPVITGPGVACVNSTSNVYYTESGMTGYTWSVTGGTIVGASNTNTITVTWNTAGAQTVSVNYTNSNSCTAASPTAKSVTVNPLPIPTITGPGAACINSTGNVYTTEAAMTNYSWTVSSGGTVTAGGTSTSNSVTVTWNTVGIQTVSVNYTNANGCTAAVASTKTVTVQTIIIPTITGPDPSCIGNTVSYSTESGMLSYVWTVSSGGTIVGPSNTSSVMVLWTSTGAQSVSVKYNDLNGCTTPAPTVKSVLVNTSPAPTITGTASICQNSTGVVYFTETGMSGYTWAVSPGGTITGGSGTSAITVSWLSAGTQSVTVNYSNSSGCSAGTPTVKLVTVLPTPVPTITGPSTACTANTVGYSTETGMVNYVWNVLSGGTITSGETTNAITVNWTAVGTHLVTVSYINSSGCPTLVPTAKGVTVSQAPSPTITGQDTTCLNGTLTYLTEPGMALYTWTVGSGGIILFGQGTNSISVKWTQAGIRTVSVSYTNTSGCPATAVKNITIYPPPVPVITGPAFGCVGGTGSVFSTATGMTGYVWSVSAGGTITSGAGTASITVTWSTTGAKSVYVSYTDTHGCTSSTPTQKDLIINDRPTDPVITGPTAACVGSTTNTYSTQADMSSYSWSVSPGGTITGGSGTSAITVTWNVVGLQTVMVNYTNVAGCNAANPGTLTVTINALPVVNSVSNQFVCNGSSTAAINFTGTGTVYTWTNSQPSIGLPASGTGNIASFTAINTGYTSITALITVTPSITNGGVTCTGAPVSFFIKVSPTPTVNSVPNQVLCNGASTTPITFTGTVAGTTFNWINTLPSIGLAPVGTGDIASFTAMNTGATTVTATITVTPWTTTSVSDGQPCNGIPTVTYEGKTYNTVQIGNQCWFKENLNVGTRINGSLEQTNNGIKEKYCYADLESNCNVYGGLYQWNELMQYVTTEGAQGLCPAGWHLPSDAEWSVLSTYLEGESVAGGKMKSIGTSEAGTGLWNAPNAGATNESGFTALPGGFRYTTGTFGFLNNFAFSWSSSQFSSANAWERGLYHLYGYLSRYSGDEKTRGQSARCLKDFYTPNVLGISCTGASVSFTITVNPTPTVNSVASQVVCNGSPTTAINFTGTGTIYNWTNSQPSIGLPASGTGNIPSFTAINTGAATVTATITVTPSGIACAGQPITFTITVYPLLIPGTASANQSICYQATPVPVTATSPAGGNPPYTYLWQNSVDGAIFNDISGATGLTYQPGSLTVSTWYRQSQTSASNCGTVYTNAVKVTVNPLPIPTITGPGAACINSTGNVYTTEAAMTNYSWTVSSGGTVTAGGTSTSNSVTVTWNTVGIQTVSVNYTNANGCTAAVASTKTVTVQTIIIPTITGPDPSCIGNTVSYSTESGMLSYVWTVSSGGTIVGPSNTSSVMVLWTSTGAQSVSVKYNDLNGCTTPAPTVKSVLVNTSPAPTITGTASICQNSTGVVYFTETGMSGYTWAVSPGGTITGGSGTSAITVSWLSAGTQSVTVNYSNSSGCSAGTPTVKLVTVLPTPVPTITGPSTACTANTVGYSTETGMVNYVWNVLSGGTITSGETTNAITVNWTAVGTHLVTVSYINSSGCPTLVPTAKGVTVSQAPSPTITGQDTTCLNGTLTYLTEPGMALYTWTVGSGGIILFGQGTNSISVKWTQAGIRTVSVSYTNTSGCPATAVKNITIYPPPVPVITGPAFGCVGGTGSVFSTATGMTGYVWSVSAGGTITSGAGTASITVTWSTTGAKSVYVSYTDTHGCTSSTPTQKDLIINDRPTDPVITGPTAACVGSTTNTYSTQADMSSYSWSVSPGGTITGGSGTSAITVTWNVAGLQTVMVNYTNTAGCDAINSGTFTTTVNVLPVPTITGTSVACLNSTDNFYYTEPGMTGYTWSVTGGTIVGASNTSTITVTWNAAGTQTVTVNYTNANSCTAAFPTAKSITINPLPIPIITGPGAACVNSTGNVYYTEPGMTGYTWSVTGGTIIGTSNTTTITVTWNTSGTQTVTVIYTNSNSCTAAPPTVKSVTVNPLPIPTITGPSLPCLNASGNVYATEIGMTGYTWTVYGGTITAGGTSTDHTITVIWTSVGTNTITVSYTNSNLCTSATPSVKTVMVDPLPVPTITGPELSCLNSPGNIYTTESGMSGYIWIVAGGIITAGGTSADTTATITWTSVGTKTVTVSYTNSNTCTTASATVKNVTVKTLPVPVITGPSSVCTNSSEDVYATEPGMTNYVWTISGGGTIISGGTATSTTATVTWNSSGAKSVSVIYTNSFGCTASTPTVYPVIVHDRPVPIITGPSAVCASTANNLYSTQTGMTNYIWNVSFGGTITSGGTVTSTTVTVTWITAGQQTVTVNYHDANGCPALTPAVKSVTVYPLPVPVISGIDTSCVNDIVTYTTESGMITYIWALSPGGIIVSGVGTNQIQVQWISTGPKTVSLNYMTPDGCTAAFYSWKNVTVYPLPVPTITGPNLVCVGSAGNVYTTESGKINYLWIVSAGGTITSGGSSGSNSVTVTWNSTGANSVKVQYTNSTGCTTENPTVYNVSVNNRPIPSITGPVNVCINSSNNVYTTQSGKTNYVWDISAGGTVTSGGTATSTTVTVSWNSAGSQSVSVNYSDATGCSAVNPTIYPVSVNPRPVPVIYGPDSVCAQTAGHVYATEPGFYNYQWAVSPGGNLVSGSGTSQITVNWTSAGTRYVTVNYTDAIGCSAVTSTVYYVAVKARPSPTITGPVSSCVGTTGNIYSTQPGMTNYQWTVSSGGTITSGGTPDNPTVTVSWIFAGPQTVYVNYTDSNGCSAIYPTTLNVTVYLLPIPTITGPTTACVNSAGNVYITQSGMMNYLWAVSTGGTITSGVNSSTATVTWNTTGTQTVTVTYTDPNGCSAYTPALYYVTVYPTPTPTITGPANACVGYANNVYSTQTGMTNYQWAVTPGGTITSGMGTNSIIVVWNTAGAHKVYVNYNNTYGCNASLPTEYNVTVYPNPVPTITGPGSVCLHSTGNVYTTQTGMTNYIWTVSSGGQITSGGTLTSNSVTVTWNGSGSQSVSVSYISANGCATVVPTVYPVTVNLLPVPTITGSNQACVGATGNVYSTESGMTNYLWTVSAGGTITSGAGTNAITVTWNTTGPKTVSVNYTNANGCTATTPTTFSVTVNSLPVPTITGAASACAGSTGNTYMTEAGMTNYQWTVSPGGTITSGLGTNSIQVAWNDPGSQSVTVNYSNALGCSAANPTVKSVTVYALPVPTLTGSTTPCANSGNYTYATDPGMSSYQWTTSPGGVITSGYGTYQVQVAWVATGPQWIGVNYTTSHGCTALVPTTLNVIVGLLPGEAGNIMGTANICGPTDGVGYSINPIEGATTYIWSLPPGATIASGGGTNAITVDYSSDASSGSIIVYGHNSCGGGVPSPPFPVTYTPIPETPVVTQDFDVLISSVPDSNQWFYQGNPIPGARDQTYTATVNGWYWDVVIVNGCYSDTSYHKHVIVTGILSQEPSELKVYPVPNDGQFTISMTVSGEEVFTIDIFDNIGSKCFELRNVHVKGHLEKIIDLRPVPDGVYTIVLWSSDKRILKKILVHK